LEEEEKAFIAICLSFFHRGFTGEREKGKEEGENIR
jgi:hypothetical protein